ncbi:hypothetical protein OIU85_007572 [Salix viminalis]|uniref:ABC transmembrane type-1 domain-containing protein n=1 Tax=Salix viminalis TaxID=40686 RepID=A0A9Q0P903_SALVM|nr:hypothetical protein OIU85_007572 [Salix viminalis]
MVRNRDFANPSTRRSRSSRLSHSLSTKSLSLRSGSLRNLSYSYSTGADGRIEMISNAETDRKNPAPDGYFFRLLKLNAPEWPYSIMGAIGSVLSGFIGPTFAIVMSNMIEVFYYRNPASMERKTKEYVFIYIGAGLYAVVAYLIQHYFFSIMGENLTTRVRRMMLAAILRNEVGWFDEEEHNSSLVAARLATDAADVKSAIAERISVILQNMTSLLTSFIVAFIVEWRVSLLILATFPLLVLANFAQQLSLKGFAGDTAKAHAKTSMIAGEGVSNIRTVAAFNAQDKVLSLFCHELRVPQLHSLRRSQTSGLLFGLSQLALYGSEALILWYGAHLVSKGDSTFSKGVAKLLVPYFQFWNVRLGLIPDDSEAEPVESIRGEIELRHVDFAYPSRPDVPVFKDFSLRIRAGQSQALVVVDMGMWRLHLEENYPISKWDPPSPTTTLSPAGELKARVNHWRQKQKKMVSITMGTDSFQANVGGDLVSCKVYACFSKVSAMMQGPSVLDLPQGSYSLCMFSQIARKMKISEQKQERDSRRNGKVVRNQGPYRKSTDLRGHMAKMMAPDFSKSGGCGPLQLQSEHRSWGPCRLCSHQNPHHVS